MKITKYNVGKGDGSSARVEGGGLLISTGSGYNSEVSDEAKRLRETHLIFGQPFNGTQDVSGDISNAQNISASGGDITVKSEWTEEGTEGGNITADGNITAGGDITAVENVKGVKFIGDVEADNVTTNTLKAESGTITAIKGERLDYDEANIRQAVIDLLTSVEITTEKLTVTKQAHFFELIIDKIKAAGGAILLTPADGFRVEKIIAVPNKLVIPDPQPIDPNLPEEPIIVGKDKEEQKDSALIDSGLAIDRKLIKGYKLLWKASDGEKAISNMWQVGDQAICQTFNAAEGTSYNVSNKYYWALVTEVGTQKIEDVDFHYITVSNSDYDGELKPEVGDEIAMLGYRGTDDVERQSAIYLAAYNSIDPSLKAPLICQYKGINDFDLKSHKYSFFAANGSEVRGNIKLESGQGLEEYVDYKAITIVSSIVEYAEGSSGITAPTSGWATKVPFIPPAKFLWTRTTVTYSDGTVTVGYSVAKFGSDGKKGEKGDDGNSYSGNLLIGTKNFEGEGWKNLNYWTDTKETYLGCKVMKRELNGYGIYQDYLAEEGTTYTFSAFIRSEGGDVRFYFETDGGAEITPQQKDVPESTEWVRTALTVKCTKSGVIRCRVQKAVGTGAVYVAGYKLERGENPNAVWTPEPSEMIGVDAEFYKLEPLKEMAVVTSGGDLNVDLKYQIIHIVGNNASTVTASSGGYFVRIRDNTQSSYINLSYTSQPSYTKKKYLEQYPNNQNDTTQYFEVYLMNGSEVLDRRIIPVTLAAVATFEITDELYSRIVATNTKVGQIENNVSTLTQTANSLTSTVSQHTTNINSLNGTVSGHTTKISQLEQTANGLKSTVESHTSDINGNKDSISKLEQTAEQIQLQVNNVSLQINDKKIVLDGETEVNGTVNVNKDGTGFRLNGSKGESFTIGSNDIGTFSNFENKTIQNWWHYFNESIVNFSTASQSLKISSLCTTLKSGQRLRITNLIASKTDYSFANSSLPQLTVSVYYKDPSAGNKVASLTLTTAFSNNQWTYQGTSAMNGTKAAIIDYTATRDGDYYLEVTGTLSGTVSGYTKINLMLAAEISLNAFGNLTYNGFGFNFGAGKVAFIGDDAMIFKMGANAGLKITAADGLQRFVPDSYKYSGANIMHHYTNSAKWIGMNDYVVRIVSDLSGGSNKGSIDIVSPKDEMLVVKSISYSIILVLPSPSTCAGKSYVIKNRSASDNLFVSGSSLTTTNAAGQIIAYNTSTGYNDSCGITTAAGTTTYRQLMKCYRNTHRLISDGEKWIDCLLSK